MELLLCVCAVEKRGRLHLVFTIEFAKVCSLFFLGNRLVLKVYLINFAITKLHC